MKISLIVPAYNEENYIGKLLDSVISQTVVPDEIIICDNNSTDNTLAVIKKYKNKLPIKIITEKQKGIRYTVKTACQKASGDLIIRADADCVLPQEWINNYREHFVEDPFLVACGGGYLATDGNYLYKVFNPIANKINSFFLLVVKGHLVLYGGNFGIRKKTFNEIDGYQSSGNIIQDDFLISQKLADGKFKYRRFTDLWNYTSTRRFKNHKQIFYCLASGLVQKFYLEKSI